MMHVLVLKEPFKPTSAVLFAARDRRYLFCHWELLLIENPVLGVGLSGSSLKRIEIVS